MFGKVRFLCLNILIIFGSITSIQGSCQIYLPNNATKPNLYRIVGSRKMELNPKPTISFEYVDYVELYENQVIEAQCDVKFQRPERYQTSNKLYFTCQNDDIRIKTSKRASYNLNDYQSSKTSLECSPMKWKLYESTKQFTWCPTNLTSYILTGAKKYSYLDHNYLAGICYDTYKQSFSSVYYTLAPKDSEYAHPSVFGNFYTPSLEIEHLKETFGRNSITDFDNEQLEKWIALSKYKHDSVMQHSKLYSSLNLHLLSLIESVWWPNLALYNWKNYVTALEQHVESENQTYDILAGVSGAIKVPIIEDCQTNYTLKEVTYEKERKIPLYVWNYLQARGNSSKGLVIIGINSPFHEFYSEEEIVFCKDKCQEIPWLKKVSSTFRYGIMGTVFCCDVEDVKSSKHLEGFPKIDMQSIPAETDEVNNSDNSDEYNAEEEE